MRELIILRQGTANRQSKSWDPNQGYGEPSVAADSSAELLIERTTPKDEVDLARDPDILVTAPIMPVHLIHPKPPEGSASSGVEWAFAATGADKSRFTGAGVTVAVLDTGIDASHPAFADVNLEVRNFTNSTDNDMNGHGTHCAGTIFGRDVGRRVGVARGVSKAFIGKVLEDGGSGGSDMLFRGIQWAIGSGANVISMSLGFDFPGMVRKLVEEDGWPTDLATSTALDAYRGNLRMFDAFMHLAAAGKAFGRDVLVVAAAGNESKRKLDPRYRISTSLPAAADGVISVAALAQSEQGFVAADFSNSHPVVSAPGVDIVSAWPGGGTRALSGTSMACPHVVGVAALWWQAIRDERRRPAAQNVAAKLVGGALVEGFAPNQEETDFGQGLVQAP